MSNKIEITVPSPHAERLQEYAKKKSMTADEAAEMAIKKYIERSKNNVGE